MSRTESAWQPLEKNWAIFGQHREMNHPKYKAVKDSLLRLQKMKLPVAAIEELQQLLKAHEQYIEESIECPECGIRGDETKECSRCHQRVDASELCGSLDLCEECQQEDDTEADGL